MTMPSLAWFPVHGLATILNFTAVIENLALSSDNGRIRVSDLPEHLFTEQATDDVSATRLSTSLSFAEVEKEAIINAAQVTGGRIQEMSALLGIGRTTLWRKMKQHGIDAGRLSAGVKDRNDL